VIQQSGSAFLKYGPVAAFLLVFSGALFAASNDKIIERIAPAGSVCMIGDSCAGGVSVASAGGAAGALDPEQTYNTYCVACHGTGANNSPVLGDAAAWQPRIDKGLDTLYSNAVNGFNNGAMPVKGLCMSCSDDDVKAAVDYILSSVQ
jgi:cytochrome c5